MYKFIAFIFLFFTGVSLASGQESVTTFGIQYKPIVPIPFFRSGPVNVKEEALNVNISPQYGSSLGMVVRRGLSKRFSLEGGINLVNRNYTLKADKGDSASTFEDPFKWVSYEIPLQLLVFIRLGEHLYMNASGGLSLDFFPSDIEGFSENYAQRTYRKSWIKPALLANFGNEWRTETSGYFYIGASYHQPFSDMAVTEVRNRFQNKKAYVYLNGSYLTFDFRYFFPVNKNRPLVQEY